jgi:hypothetical protein
VVVPVVGGDEIDVAVLGGEPARGLHRLAGLLERGLFPRSGLPVRVDLLEHRAVGGHQPLGDLLVLVFERLQFLACAFGQRAHPAAEHLRGVIAGPGLRGEHQRGHQRDPLGGAVVAHHRGVGGGSLAGEIGDLRRGHLLPPRPRVPEALDPALALQLLAELRPRRSPRGPGELVELALAPGPGDQQALQTREPGLAEPARHQREDLLIDPRPDRRGHVIERTEGRQLIAALHQPLQGDVDQIGRVVLPPGGLLDRLGSDLAGARRVVDDLAARPDQVTVPLSRTRRGIHRAGSLRQPQVAADVPYHLRRHLVQRREVAQPAERLQLDDQAQQMLIRARVLPRPGDLLRGRGVEHVQLPGGHEPPEARVGRPLHRRHEPTRPVPATPR